MTLVSPEPEQEAQGAPPGDATPAPEQEVAALLPVDASDGQSGEVFDAAPTENRPRRKLVNPNLSANLHADYEALQNDVEQANELAAEFQRQLAGKSNEFAQLKQVFEKTVSDLKHLQAGIVELRTERHNLANEAMRATAFELKLNKVTGERDRLRADLEVVRTALTKSADELARIVRERDTHAAGMASVTAERDRLREALTKSTEEAGRIAHERDAQIASMVIELVMLKQALTEAQRASGEGPGPRRAASEPRPPKGPGGTCSGSGDAYIGISFND